MEVRRKISVIITLTLLMVLMTACGKKYYEYPNSWISEDGCVTIETNGIAHINYKGIDAKKTINILSDSGQQYLYFCYDDNDNDCFWEVNSSIKNDKMYLDIVVDNVTNLQGKTIVLEQEKK